MSSRYAAARPKRAGETFARQHHGEREGGNLSGSDGEGAGESSTSKKVKFDVRNPSALAPEAREDDDVLDADVIGVGAAATKRGAVNIDGYDSDSDNDTFNDRAEQRKKTTGRSGKKDNGEPDVNLLDQLDSYDKRLKSGGKREDTKKDKDEDEDEDDDMFGDDDDEDNDGAKNGDAKDADGDDSKKKRKEVKFLRFADIAGQEKESRSRAKIRLGEVRDGEAVDSGSESSTSDEDDAALEIQEEDIDKEVGAGGLKRHAPKVDAFNMRSEREEGAFDESGNFIRKAVDPDALHDRWLDGVSKREMRKAAEAHERRVADVRQQRREADNIVTADLFAALITQLETGETPLEALARLGKGLAASKTAKAKKIPQWKLKKLRQKQGDQMDVDGDESQRQKTTAQDPEQAKRKASIDAITEAADNLLNRDYPEIYDYERERLVREYKAETGEAWVDRPRAETPEADNDMKDTYNKEKTNWQFRWTDGRDGAAIQGPFDGAMMKAWQDAGYFGEAVEFREVGGDDDDWTRLSTFV